MTNSHDTQLEKHCSENTEIGARKREAETEFVKQPQGGRITQTWPQTRDVTDVIEVARASRRRWRGRSRDRDGREGPGRQGPLTRRLQGRAEKETSEIKWKTQRPRDGELETERQEIGSMLLGQKHTQAGKWRL